MRMKRIVHARYISFENLYVINFDYNTSEKRIDIQNLSL